MDVVNVIMFYLVNLYDVTDEFLPGDSKDFWPPPPPKNEQTNQKYHKTKLNKNISIVDRASLTRSSLLDESVSMFRKIVTGSPDINGQV